MNWAADEWCPSTESRINPLPYFAPIVNDSLFGSGAASGSASFEGGQLSNFRIGNQSGETGLFAHANCTISGMRLVDPIVRGGSYTGTLVGRAYGGSITDCGVYLTTTDGFGIEFSQSVMQERLDTYQVSCASSSSYVGGLIGAAERTTTISDSFAAINVAGSTTYAGGLIGSFTGASVVRCYSSGDVEATAYAGGLTGNIGAGSISDSYSTSCVIANHHAAGFAGNASGGSISDCTAYGTVQKSDGSIDLSTSGGFLGAGSTSLSGNAYLRQNGYNSDYDKQSARSGVTATSYTLLKASTANSVSGSFPYSTALRDTAFPFEMVLAAHYGNWPQESTIDTSLVYYEKYTNDAGNIVYGYYADGFAKTGDGSSASAWNLDTLKSQEELDDEGYWLTEDGYAMLSIYNLVKINYSLNGASQVTINAASEPGANKFVLMENPQSLPLSAIDRDSGAVIGKFSVKYLYIFQLPFELQETNRDASFAFYDMAVISGYAKGDTGAYAFENYKFYYCPHFAKNAINPDVNATDPGRPKYPEELVAYVRSPRQLNALGRYCYYWSRANNSSQSAYRLKFTQEIDLNYPQYTRTYCGRTFNLTDISASNTYRNRPIGRPVGQAFTDPWGVTYSPGSFQNAYNGNGHKIIDYKQYCYKDDKYQFAGLFGEIKSASISNVILMATAPSQASGVVCNEYVGTEPGKSAGTGALVGLSYAMDKTDLCMITNCAVSGYIVEYKVTGSMIPNFAAVGGLIGYNMGNVSGCSADTYRVTADVASSGSTKEISVSGLIGGIVNGTVTDCYAGGTLQMAASGMKNTSSVNGVAGYSYVWSQFSSGTFSVRNCYSFCAISQANATRYKVYGAGGMTSGQNGSGSFTDCSYLSDSVAGIVTLTSASVLPQKPMRSCTPPQVKK